MSIIKNVEQKLKEIIAKSGYELENVVLQESGRRDLGEYQLNDAMQLAKKYGKAPREIANDIVKELEKESMFTNINIAGPGFINLSLSQEFLLNSLKLIDEDINNNIDKVESRKIMLDYGGANIAKTLHVGHLRSANIGEALKRLARFLGHEVIADVHFGDIGRQSGMVISEIKRRMPSLPYFDSNYQGDYSEVILPITEEDLTEIYPQASTRAKEDEQVMEEVITITKELENGHKGYTALWDKIKKLSIEDIKRVYKELNTDFDLWEGESDCYPYIPEVIKYLEDNKYLRESEGAKVIDIATDTDNSPMPPLVVIKSNGATLYATRELATLYSRMKRFNPDELWYLTDSRQSLYFEQVFRASKKTKLVKPETKLEFIGFGTMNGKDGKPFKTRDGGVMSLKDLLAMIKEETLKRTNPEITDEQEKDKIASIVAIAALKYADFLPFRTTDYIFDLSKFVDLEGKTGPYLLYSTVRMKSLLTKAKEQNITYDIKELKNTSDREIILTLLSLPNILQNSLASKSLNEIAEYLYKLTSNYNKFYAENKILTEENKDLQATWLKLTEVVYNTNCMLLNILGITIPEKM